MGAHATTGERRIGVFGGTFDPPHVGHLIAAVEVRAVLGLDRLLLTVANRPWQKVGARMLTPAPVRLAMVDAAVAGFDGVEASGMEIRRGGDSYTADTLAELAHANPDADLFMVVGEDAAALLDTWERIDEVHALATIVVVARAGTDDAEGPGRVDGALRVAMPRVDISSTHLRERIAAGQPIDGYCPPGVVRAVESHGLYGEQRT